MRKSYLFAKAGIHPDWETATGFLFGTSGLSLWLANKYPTATFRTQGFLGILGSITYSLKGVDFDKWQIMDKTRFYSTLISFVLANGLILFQKEIARFAEKYKDSENRIARILANAARRPVVLGAAVSSGGIIGLAKSAVENGDMQAFIPVCLLSLGAGVLAVSDPRVRERIQNYLNGNPKGFKPEQPIEAQSESQEEVIFDRNQLDFPFAR